MHHATKRPISILLATLGMMATACSSGGKASPGAGSGGTAGGGASGSGGDNGGGSGGDNGGSGTGGNNSGGGASGSGGGGTSVDAPVDHYEPPITIKVAVSPPSVTLAVGATAQFSASVTGATSNAVTWSTSGGSISAAGLYSAPALGGSYIVTARSVEDPRAYGTAHADVTGSTLSQPDPIRDHTVSPAIYLRAPVQGMQFLAPATVTIMADSWDGTAPTKVDFMDGTAVVATVDNAGVGGGSAAGYFLRGIASNLAAGTHELWVRETSVGGGTHDSTHLTVTVVDPPTYATTITLDADMPLTGDISWVGTADKPILIQGNGHKITSADSWTGKLTAKYVHFRNLGADPTGALSATAQGMRVSTTGGIDIENSLFEHCAQVVVFANGNAGVTFRGNTLNENTAVAVDNGTFFDGSNGYSIVTFTGSSPAAKVFAGNRVSMGWVRFENSFNWTVGGKTDADSNILMGPRGGILMRGNQNGATNSVVSGNFTLTNCPNRWTQCTNLLFDSVGTGLILEHNILVGGWTIRPFSGEARYNVIVAGGEAFMQGWAAGASLHHNIINNLGIHAPGFDNNIFDIYTPANKGIEIYNNTWDAGGNALALYGPAIRVRGGATLKSIRSNAFVHFPYYLAPVVTGDRDMETKTGPQALADYIDYNAFYNPEHKTPMPQSYYGKTTTNATPGSPGFGGHDVGGFNADVDPKLAGTTDKSAPENSGLFPFSQGDIWARKATMSLMLQQFANYYRPDTGSPLTDAGDPADGDGNDVGAIDTGRLNAKFTPFDAWGK